MTRFTISTDPDGKSYLFGKNDPEPHEGFLSGGTELFAWEPEAVEALRSTLAATVELSALRERIAERVAHAQRRLDADPGSDYWRGALVAAVQVEITTRRSDEGTTYDVVAGDQSWSWSTPWTPGDPIDQTPDCPGIPPAAADRGDRA